jgi:nitronate monooxygenase
VTLHELDVPIVLAPMAGGPSTPALCAAVSNAGGLGFLAGGYLSGTQLHERLDETRGLTARPFGINLFVPSGAPTAPAVYSAYVERLAGEGALGEPRWDDDDWDAKLALMSPAPPAVVSFTFGCPAAGVLAAVREAGAAAWVTVTSADEARQATAAGADALVVQGAEAGGHRGTFIDAPRVPAYGLLALLQLVAEAVPTPLVATGGIASARGVAAVLAAGASAAQVGTAFMRCPEAGTSEVHRSALASDTPTALTRAFSGRLARGIRNRFMDEHGAHAPLAYPEIHHVTAPLRKAGRERGDGDVINLWAGEAHRLAQARPAAEVVAQLAAGVRR